MRFLVGVVAILASSGVVQAKPFPSLPALVAVKDVTATSTFADKRDAYAAWRTLAYETRPTEDGMGRILWSAWCEGKPGAGLGETVTITFPEPTQLDSVKIAAGVWRSQKLHVANNQITGMDVLADGKPLKSITPAGRNWIEVRVGSKVTSLAFKITAAKPGRMTDSCIAGIDLVRQAQRLVPIIGVDAKQAAALPVAMREIGAAIVAPKRKGLDALLAFPFSAAHVDGFFAGAEGATVSKTWAQVAAACKAYDAAMQRDEDADYIDPKGCPTAVPTDPSDEARALPMRATGPGTVIVGFPDGREVMATWKLVWKGRWKLQSIDLES